MNIAVCGNVPDSRFNWKSLTLTVKGIGLIYTMDIILCFQIICDLFLVPEAPTVECEPVVKNGLLQSFTVDIFEVVRSLRAHD